MIEIPLFKSGVALIDDEDYELVSKHKWYLTKRYGKYYAMKQDGMVKMHRLILGVSDPKIWVDHADGNGLNNQRSNIRVATASQNNANRSAWGESKYLGVHKRGKKWVAQIRKDKKIKQIGTFIKE